MVTVAPTTQIPNQTSFLSILQRLELQTSTSMQKSWWQLTLKKNAEKTLHPTLPVTLSMSPYCPQRHTRNTSSSSSV